MGVPYVIKVAEEEQRNNVRIGLGAVGTAAGSVGIQTVDRGGLITGREKMYHVTPQKNVDSIMENGIDASHALDPDNLTSRINIPKDQMKNKVYLARNKFVAESVKEGMKNHGLHDPVDTIFARVPSWMHKEVDNPELRGAKNFADYDRLMGDNINWWTKSEFERRLLYRILGRDGTATFEGSIGPEYIKGSRHYKPQTAKELFGYIKNKPKRFLGGVGLGIASLGSIGLGLSQIIKGYTPDSKQETQPKTAAEDDEHNAQIDSVKNIGMGTAGAYAVKSTKKLGDIIGSGSLIGAEIIDDYRPFSDAEGLRMSKELYDKYNGGVQVGNKEELVSEMMGGPRLLASKAKKLGILPDEEIDKFLSKKENEIRESLSGPLYSPHSRKIYNVNVTGIEGSDLIDIGSRPYIIGHELGHARIHKALGKMHNPLQYLVAIGRTMPLYVGGVGYMMNRGKDDKKANTYANVGLGVSGAAAGLTIANEAGASAIGMKYLRGVTKDKDILNHGKRFMRYALGTHAAPLIVPLSIMGGAYAIDRSIRAKKQKELQPKTAGLGRTVATVGAPIAVVGATGMYYNNKSINKKKRAYQLPETYKYMPPSIPYGAK